MIDGRKVVVCTPAGRQEYLEILIPYILRSRGVIDEYQIWLNTQDESDIAYIRNLESLFPGFVRVVDPDPNIPIIPDKKGYSIYQFFKGCVERGTVYIRLDDDIVFVDKEAIETLARFRIQNPQYFLVYGNIINNSICSHLHQRFGIVDQQAGTVGYWCVDDVGWNSGLFAEHCHRWFFHHYHDGRHDKYKFKKWDLNVFERVSINVISWLGDEFAEFNGEVGVDEEQWLSVDKPLSISKMNAICGQSLFAHYAFYVQREHVNTTNILNLYRQVSELETRKMGDREKLLHVLSVILSAPLEKLKDVEFLEHMIRLAGLYPDNRNLYGDKDNGNQNESMGSWQVPRQLAELLIALQDYRISSYLDVGSFQGWTCSLVSAVLLRFNPDLKVTAIDPQPWWTMHPEIAAMLPITYINQNTDHHVGKSYDFTFIDGNHEYTQVMKDYTNVGAGSKLCAFHDCNDDYIRHCPYQAGGVPKVWDELKAKGLPNREFFMHSEGKNVMGIGLLVNLGAGT